MCINVYLKSIISINEVLNLVLSHIGQIQIS